MTTVILRLPEIIYRTGLGRSTTYNHVDEGLLPPLIKIGDRAVGLPEHEVESINSARISGKSNDDIKALVKMLVSERSAGLSGDSL